MSAPNIVLKPGAYMILGNLDAASISILRAIASTAPPLHDNELWITSAADRRRGIGVVNSLHPAGQAWDFRTQPGTGGRPRPGMVIANGPADRLEKCRFWADRARSLLGPDYDIVVEADHVHAEYDPKPLPVAAPKETIVNQVTILGIVRHLLTFGGGFIAAQGWADEGLVNEGIGAFVTLLGVIWSVVEKARR